MMKNDPILDEIRRVRHQISAQFDHDPVKLVAHYMRLQERRLGGLVMSTETDNSVLSGLSGKALKMRKENSNGR